MSYMAPTRQQQQRQQPVKNLRQQRHHVLGAHRSTPYYGTLTRFARSLATATVTCLIFLSVLKTSVVPVQAEVTPNGGMVWDGNGWIALYDDDSRPSPPPPKSESWKRSDTQIFVGVSSFRDKRCPQTLVNFFTKAKYPKRVKVGVVQQNGRDDVDCVKQYCQLMGKHEEGPLCPYFDNIKTVRVEAKHAAGPCYGRHLQVILRDVRWLVSCERVKTRLRDPRDGHRERKAATKLFAPSIMS